jgi:hypothetical protein
MKKLITILILTAITATADELWVSGREKEWDDKKPVFWYVVDTFNVTITNEVVTTNGSYFVTNYAHTAENTNNVLHQLNFGYTNSAGDNVWIMGYTSEKCGGFDIDAKWAVLHDYCENNKKLNCARGMGLTEYMALNGYGHRTNQWITLSIPFVDDNKKVNERKSEYQKEKKK